MSRIGKLLPVLLVAVLLSMMMAVPLIALGVPQKMNSAETFFDPSIVDTPMDTPYQTEGGSIILFAAESCVHGKIHNSSVVRTGLVRVSNPPWYQVICKWCRTDKRWVR